MKKIICMGLFFLLTALQTHVHAQRVYNPTYISEETKALEWKYIEKDAPPHTSMMQDTSLNYYLVLPQIGYYPGRETTYYRDLQAPFQHNPPSAPLIVPLYRNENQEENLPVISGEEN